MLGTKDKGMREDGERGTTSIGYGGIDEGVLNIL